MVIAVTGAGGHIGANLVRRLLERGDTVRALVRDERPSLRGLDVETIRGDVRDARVLERLTAGAELVYHLAARISIVERDSDEVFSVNVAGTRAVVEACLRSSVRRMVHFSSIHALASDPAHEPIDESRGLVAAEREPSYDRSKAAGEREVQAGVARGLDAVVLNPTGVLGPYDYEPSAMGRVLLDLYHRRLPGVVRGAFDWVDVRDVVTGALAAAERGRAGERYLLSGARHSLADIAQAVEQATGRRAPRLVAPMWLAELGVPLASAHARLTGRPPQLTRMSLLSLRRHLDVRHDKAARELSHRPRPLRESVEGAFAWFADAGML